MRQLMMILFVLLWAMPAVAQLQYVKAPISIENAFLSQPSEPSQFFPVAVPISETIEAGSVGGGSTCIDDSGAVLNVAVVDSGIDVSYDVVAIFQCTQSFALRFDVVLEVPVLSLDPGAFVYLTANVASPNVTALGEVQVRFEAQPSGSSTQVPTKLNTDFAKLDLGWTDWPPVFVDQSEGINVLTMFPGDTVRIPVEMFFLTRSNDAGDVRGEFSIRYEFRTRFPVPEPSAALSLPLGAAWLAGLASLRS